MSTLATIYSQLDRGLTVIERTFVGAAIAASTLVLGANVALRYVFSAPISWAEEFSILLMIWSVFIGGSLIMRSRGHLAVDLLQQNIGTRYQPALTAVVGLITLALLITVTVYGTAHAMNVYKSGQTMPMLRWSAWISYAAVPSGCCLMAVRTVQNLAEDLAWSLGRDSLREPLNG